MAKTPSATMRLRNISPLGDLTIPALGLTVAADETFDVDIDLAQQLLEQDSNFTAVTEG
jgi:hypothetical protein